VVHVTAAEEATMAKIKCHEAVADALRAMGVETVTTEIAGRKHPRVLWSDRGGSIRGIVTCTSTPSDRRSLLNCISDARRQVRLARGE
jgi:hypothetical protein